MASKKPKSIKRKLFKPIAIWFVISGVLWILINNYFIIRDFSSLIKNDAQLHINALNNNLTASDLNLSEEKRVSKIKSLIGEKGIPQAVKYAFFSKEGRVLYSTNEEETGKIYPEISSENEEFREVLSEGKFIAEITFQEKETADLDDKIFVEVYAPLQPADSNKPVGVIEVWYSFDMQLWFLIENGLVSIIIGGSFFLFFWIFMIMALNKYILKDIEKIYRQMEPVKSGDYSKKIEPDGSKEMDDLINFLNGLIGSLKENKQELKEINKSLEKEVEEKTKEAVEAKEHLEEEVENKTKELQKKLKELEKFKNETIGREMRIIELKKEVEKLKKENKDNN